MQCCVPFCENISNVFRKGNGDDGKITFYAFPSEMHLRVAWLGALGIREIHLPDSAVVCSRHFLNDDIRETETGLRAGAIPSTVLVCMVCLQTDCELLLLSKHKLEESYVKLTGYPLQDQRNIRHTVCVQCAQSLTDFSRFRDQSLRARTLMRGLVQIHDLITIQDMKMMDRTTLQSIPSDRIKVEWSDEDQHTELDNITYKIVETVAVKHEVEDSYESTNGRGEGSMDEDEQDYTLYKPLNSAPAITDVAFDTQDLIKSESVTFQCTFCFGVFSHEHHLNVHECMHVQNTDTAASSSYESSHVTVNSESTKASTTTGVQTITSRKKPKTNAQRCREYRERQKLQNAMVQNVTAVKLDECSETGQLQAKKRPKTNAERRKKHYEAQKLKRQQNKKIPKSAKQRNKEYYERKKQKIQALKTLNHH